jgi:hypothetical protein
VLTIRNQAVDLAKEMEENTLKSFDALYSMRADKLN